ncbi:MAG: hypothetical protein Q4B26_11100 [Eubacteriales bacterium]|nr:hypothetical protein [Eubacteriales bacterium]
MITIENMRDANEVTITTGEYRNLIEDSMRYHEIRRLLELDDYYAIPAIRKFAAVDEPKEDNKK